MNRKKISLAPWGPSAACRSLWLRAAAMLLLCLLPWGAAWAGVPAALLEPVRGKCADAAKAFAEAPAIAPTDFAVLIVDLANGDTLACAFPDKPLWPASILKSVTTASLMTQRPIDWRYDTPVYLTGPVEDGVLQGDLLIRGSGDPSLNSSRMDNAGDLVAETVAAVKAAGIRSIQGDVLADNSLFAAPERPLSWDADNSRQWYGAGAYALNFDHNRSGRLALDNPCSLLILKTRTALQQAGIEVKGEAISPGRAYTLLFTHQSPPLDDIMRSCMMRSDNLFAECMLRTYALARGGKGDYRDGARLETDYWKGRGLPMAGVNIEDGSGLSRSNKVTARFMGSLLKKMAGSADYVSYFPLAGAEGTVKGFLDGTPLAEYIALKSGSLDGVQCYAGYKLDDEFAPTHLVVVMVNGFKGKREPVRAAISRLLSDCFQ